MTERPVISPKREYMENNYAITKYKKYIYIYTYIIIGFSIGTSIGFSYYIKNVFNNCF